MSAEIIRFPIPKPDASVSDEVFHEMAEYMRSGLLLS